MARRGKNQQRNLFQRIAGGGANQSGRGRRSNRPRGEGRGLISTVRSLFGRR
jgi:hypothetical protein